MEKTIFLGDTHGRSFWKLAIYQEQPNRVIFIGDYFDSFDISAVEQIHNFKEIIQFKKDNPQIKIIMLIGNHDFHYFPKIGYNGTSGYQAGAAPNISQIIDENRKHLQMAYNIDNILCTHAGIGEAWMERLVKKDIVKWLPNYNAHDIANFIKEQNYKFKFPKRL